MHARSTISLLTLSLALACAPRKPVVRDHVLAPPPRPAEDPKVVLFDGAVAHRFLRAETPGTTIVRLRIDTKDLSFLARPKINLALVVDTSGSMEGEAIEDARRASLALLDAMRPGDRLSIVTFGSRAQVIVPSNALDATTIANARERIGAMGAEGTTDMAAGLSLGIQQVEQHFASDGVNRVVLLGDGVPNDETPILPMARAAGERGITITSLGLGDDYDETLMAGIATSSGGRFHYIEDSARVADVFVGEVLRLTHVVGRSLYVTIRPGPGVVIARIPGHTIAPRTDTVIPLGDLVEGEPRDLIVELHTPARKSGAAIELIDAFLSFDDAVAHSGRHERHVYVSTRSTDDAAAISGGEDIDVLRAAARAALAAAVLEAIAAARAGKLEQARAILDRAEQAARAAASKLPDDKLDEALAKLAPLRASLPTLIPPPPIDIAQPPQSRTFDPHPVPANAPAVIRETHDYAVQTTANP